MNLHDSNGRTDNITLEAVLLPAGNASRNTVGVLHCRLFTCLLSVHFFFPLIVSHEIGCWIRC